MTLNPNCKFRKIVGEPTSQPFGAPNIKLPLLKIGDRLTCAEFERRYHAMPHVKKAGGNLWERVVRSLTRPSVLGYSRFPCGLRIEPPADGTSRISDDDYIEGAPELVVEMSPPAVPLTISVSQIRGLS